MPPRGNGRRRTPDPISEALGQGALPVQPVERPILCPPYDEPTAHWLYDSETGAATKTPGRRPASYWFRSERTGAAQLSLSIAAEEERDDLPLVNALRDDVRRWREHDYPGATPVTRQLLRHWASADRPRRLFFCQREAVETIVYLNEILASGKRTRWTPRLAADDFARLRRGDTVAFESEARLGRHASLADVPNEAGVPALLRYGCKMATGSGKTVVMSMLVAWAFCNRGRTPWDERFPSAALIVCPNLTIRDRLQVLRPERADNYYEAFDLVPQSLLGELRKGRVLVTNWHAFAPESEHAEGGRTYAVVNKGPESPPAFARRVLGDLSDRDLMVLNDEAHHAYRPKPLPPHAPLSADERAEREEATVWVSGLDRINQARGVRFCVDLSATPFYLDGSGYVVGSPFPWLVSDFGLVDAIESGIVKIPRLPVSDTSGRPEPRFFALWKHITGSLRPGERLPGGKPRPEVVWREAEGALLTLASQWVERFSYVQQATAAQEHVPPVLIIVCDNTDVAEYLYEKISGERTIDAADEDEPDDDTDDEAGEVRPAARARGSRKKKITYGQGAVFHEHFANGPGLRRTLRIDSKLLAQADAGATGNKRDAAEALREIVATVGRTGQPGEQVRCVVSVQMLSEGWDANNVTHILGLRAFGSQLLCEQVVGRGLRRMDYTPDPASGLLTEEYVDVYGVPFSLIPFKGRESTKSATEDRPKNHVRALAERAQHEIRFPVVEGYALDLKRNLVTCDVREVERLRIEPDINPTAVFVQPQVGYRAGVPRVDGVFAAEHQDRRKYYESTQLQTIQFEIARVLVERLTSAPNGRRPKLAMRSRHQLFPQVYRIVDDYVGRRVEWRGVDRRELGMERYFTQAVERLTMAIEPIGEAGELALLPLLNRNRPVASSAVVNFKTVRPCVGTTKSHVNQVVADTDSWEQAAVFRLEASPHVRSYVRNDHLELGIGYDFLAMPHTYFPDFLVRLVDGRTVLLEIKGQGSAQDDAKHQAARRWVSAVNRWGQEGRWDFLVCRDPQLLSEQLATI